MKRNWFIANFKFRPITISLYYIYNLDNEEFIQNIA